VRTSPYSRHAQREQDRRNTLRHSFATVVIDPPWPYPEGFNGFGNRRELPYGAMTIDDIQDLKVTSLLKREGYLFMWTTNKYLGPAFDILSAWGLTYRQTLTWCKPEVGGLGGMFGTNTEFILVGQKIKPGTNAHGARTKGKRLPTSWFEWPRREHSQKPEEFYDILEQVAPPPYADVFARRMRLGWKSFGDEVDGRDIRLTFAEIEGQLATPTSPAK
jgi:N6-adenosine-specific RNA methylase IME4